MYTLSTRSLLLAVTLMSVPVLLPVPVTAAAGEVPELPAPGLRFDPDSGELSLHTSDTPLAEILDEITESAGVEFIHSGLGDDLVTSSFQRLSIVDALKRILPNYGYMIQLDPHTRRPARVWVMPRRSAADMAEMASKRKDRVVEKGAAREEELIEQLEQGNLSEEDTERIIRGIIEDESGELLEELLADPEATGDRK